MSKKILILGGGESGIGASLLAISKGYTPLILDEQPIKNEIIEEANQNKIKYEVGKFDPSYIEKYDLIIKSPGIPNENNFIVIANEKGKNIISEIEFASWYCNAKIIGVTGTNGKTTTVELIYEILKNAGKKVLLCGNIGISFSRLMVTEKPEFIVLELSSFQLEHINKLKLFLGTILNISNDHLERYEQNFELYIQAKLNIYKAVSKEGNIIYPLDDEILSEEIKYYEVNKYSFSYDNTSANGYIKDNNLIIKKNNKQIEISLNKIQLIGKHNKLNLLVSGIVCHIIGIEKEIIENTFNNFKPQKNRMELIKEWNGIRFINDSKATNIDSVEKALDTINGKIILIMGGIDKGNDYEKIKNLVKNKVKKIIIIGKDNSKIIEAFKEINYVETKSMELAVKESIKVSEKGDTILLSPACSSFDLFKNYEDRGNQFIKQVQIQTN